LRATSKRQAWGRGNEVQHSASKDLGDFSAESIVLRAEIVTRPGAKID